MNRCQSQSFFKRMPGKGGFPFTIPRSTVIPNLKARPVPAYPGSPSSDPVFSREM